MATITAGVWIPFVSSSDASNQGDDDEEFDYAQPGPTIGSHDVVLPHAGGKVVDLTKKPKPKPPVSLHKPPANRPPVTTPTAHKPPVTHPVTPPPVADKPLSILVSFLRAQVGDDYVLGGNGPADWDCSGLTVAAFAKVGVHLPRTSELQSLVGVRVSTSQLQVGDLLFWGLGPGLAYHVTVYIGGGHFIGAQNPSTGVVQRSVSYDPPDFARRVL